MLKDRNIMFYSIDYIYPGAHCRYFASHLQLRGSHPFSSHKSLYNSPMATAAFAHENNVRKIGIFSCFSEKGRISRVIRYLMPYSFTTHERGWKQFPSSRISLSLAKAFYLVDTSTFVLGNLWACKICSLYFSHWVPLPIQLTKPFSPANTSL